MTEMSIVCPGETLPGRFWLAGPLRALPLSNTRAYEVLQVQEPTFFKRQVLVKDWFRFRMVPSGMETSLTNWALSQGTAVGGTGVAGGFVGWGVLVGGAVGAAAVEVGGRVGLPAVMAVCVSPASMVCARAVMVAWGPSEVGVTCAVFAPGKLQARAVKTSKANKRKIG